MAINTETIMPIGMNRDALIGTGNSDKYAFENLNLRYIASEDSTTGSWTVEKSTKEETQLSIGTNVLGQAVINDTLVLFIKSNENENPDYIIKVWYEDTILQTSTLYHGNLNFSKKIETTTYYENENIQKVYWVDGINPLRMINISRVKASSNFDTQFDVLPELDLNEIVTIEKSYDGSGMFPSGTTQYFFTYIDKYGRESNIFYASSLYYNSLKDRGLNPDGSEYASCSYKINITDLDSSNEFDYVRIYSIIRPYEGATPIARIVVDLDLNISPTQKEGSIFYIDTNTTGEIIDYTTVMFLGGKPIIPYTIEQKNNTLFLGNLKVEQLYSMTPEFKEDLKNATTLSFVNEPKKAACKDTDYLTQDYPFNKALNLSADDITTFKKGMTYRFAVQFQDKYGNWTEAIYLGDVVNNKNNSIDNKVTAKATIDFGSLIPNYPFISNYLKKVRLLCTYPKISDRDVVAQGVLCPTMYHPAWEKTHAPDRFSSWFFRPEKGTAPVSIPTIHAAEQVNSITVSGDYSTKIEVDSSIENWSNYTTAPEKLLKVSIENKALDKVFSVEYSHDTASYKEYIDDHDQVSGSYKYVQATVIVTVIGENTTTTENAYFIRLYEYNPYSLYFRPYVNLDDSTNCQISNSTNNNTEASVNVYAYDGSNPGTSATNSWKITYAPNNQFIIVVDDIIPGLTPVYAKKVSYKYFVAHTYTVHTSPTLDTDIMQFSDYNESLGVVIDLNSVISGFNRNSYYYYNGDVDGGYGWDSKGRVINEVQSADNPSTNYQNPNLDTIDDWGFYIDNKNYFTLHSPDTEYNESLQTTNIQDCKLKIIGQVNQTSWASDIDVDANVATDYNGNKGEGLIKNIDNNKYLYPSSSTPYVRDVNRNPGYWKDIDVYASNSYSIDEDEKQIDYYQYQYIIYPFHRKFLNNYVRDVTIKIAGGREDHGSQDVTIKSSGKINYKCISNYRIFGHNDYYVNSVETEDNVNANFYIDNSYTPVILKSSNTVIKYAGTIDDIAEPRRELSDESDIRKYDGLFSEELSGINPGVHKGITVETSCITQLVNKKILTLKGAYPVLANYYKRVGSNTGSAGRTFLAVDTEGPQIRFKSNTHIVLNLSEFTTNNSWPTRTVTHPSLYLAELTKTVTNRYGGNSSTAIKNNIFYPCGEAKTLTSSNAFELKGGRGDCYYMAYDCLKTYPYSNEERNSIVEAASFNCETYINLNGRYDKYIGQMVNITNIDKTKFGLINLGYTQNKDFFSYHVTDNDDDKLVNYPNQITWTKTKTPGEIVDTWTNITLANVANAEGTMGSITSLNIYNDNLLMFQEHGIAQLGYNEKTAISTENGLPLEIASSNKFTGFAYLSKEIGCQNKWSINTSKNGIMFIDNSRKELNVVGESIVPLSTKHGFDHFFINELEVDPDFTTYYDKLSKDIYYLNSRCCLAFNEVSGTFTSFYNYEGITALATISNHSIVAKNGSIWALREGDNYSNYFNVTKPYKMVVCCDGGKYFQTDKVFNTVETRSDIFNPNSINSTVDENPFDTIAAWTSYQKPVDFALDGTDPLYEWSAARRYNIWRYIVPRATYNDSQITRDRIRNPFAFIKLERKTPNGNRAIIHDMVISYDIR